MAARPAAASLPDGVDKELRTRYRQLRVMLHTAGLAATYAYIASKAGDRRRSRTAGQAGRGVPGRGAGHPGAAARPGHVPRCRATGRAGVLTQLGGMDPVEYARASAEAAAFVGWLSRLADAVWQETGGRDGFDDDPRPTEPMRPEPRPGRCACRRAAGRGGVAAAPRAASRFASPSAGAPGRRGTPRPGSGGRAASAR